MVCTGVIIINKGSIVAQGPIDSLVEQFFPTARLHVQLAGPAPAIRDALRGIPGVVAVQEEPPVGDATHAFVVESPRGHDVRAEVFQLAAQQKWHLLELRRAGMTLEEVFIRVVAGEETDGGAEPTPAPRESTT
jgi:ABC-type multidrug transport system ATPase subunit